jgi:hypothetical protein
VPRERLGLKGEQRDPALLTVDDEVVVSCPECSKRDFGNVYAAGGD